MGDSTATDEPEGFFIMKKSYYAIIPANVRYNKSLTANAKLLYGEITALCNEEGYCWASNHYFSDLYGVSKTSISKWISQLEKENLIKSHIKYKEGTKEILNRYLTLVTYPIEEKLNTPIEEKLKDNNTVINNTVNNKSYVKSEFSQEVENCFNECLKYFEEHLHPGPSEITKWKDTIEKLNRIDKVPFEKIVEIVKKTREDSFWSSNFLTLNKLRKKKDGVMYVVIFNEKIKSKAPKQTASETFMNQFNF